MRSTLIFLYAAAFMALLPSSAQADPPRTPALQCTAGGLAEPPKFSQLSPGRAEYRFGGVCISREGHSFAYRIHGTWTPTENGRGNASATEVMHMDMTSGPSRSYTILFGASCSADPWLYGSQCQRIGDNMPDEVRAWWWDAQRAPFPFSRNGIPRDQRAALRAAYDRANGVGQPVNLHEERVALEPAEKIGTLIGTREVPAQAALPSERSVGSEAGIIIVSGSGEPDRPEAAAAMLGTILLPSTSQSATGATSEAAVPQNSICEAARKARARNSPSAPGLERRCAAAGPTPYLPCPTSRRPVHHALPRRIP